MTEKDLEKQRIRRKNNNYSSSKTYEKTPKGFLMRVYRNMKSRVEGIQKLKSHLYIGKVILTKEEFYNWSTNCIEFYSLFENYKNSNFDRKLAPSVDRIDSDKGYEIGNIRFITHSKNSSLGTFKRNEIYGNPSVRKNVC